MASFNAITLEKNAIKREKLERRRGPKPARTSLLWAQTSWLEAKVALGDGHVLFQDDGRTWNFEGALLETTRRALDKLAWRALSGAEIERLRARRHNWQLWHACASLEHLEGAELRARLVLESLLDAPLLPSAARELCRLPVRQQIELLRELDDEALPARTRELARWIGRNRGAMLWQKETAFPVSLACYLGFEGDAMPPIFSSDGELALDVAGVLALLEERAPERTREIAQFWCEARWEWPSVRTLCASLKAPQAHKLGKAWRALEDKWRAQWVGLWREIALSDLEAAKRALQFHELLVDTDFSRWQETIHKSATREQLLKRFDEHNKSAFELMETLKGHRDAASLIDYLGELWLEYDETQTEHFWYRNLVPSLKAARAIGVEATRKMRGEDYFYLARMLDDSPELLLLAVEWAQRGEGTDASYQLRHLPSNARTVTVLRREAEQCFALIGRFPALEAPTRGSLWESLLPDEEKYALSPVYWRLVRAVAPICLAKTETWHKDNVDNLGQWAAFWAKLACDFGWSEGESVVFGEKLLGAIECRFKVLEEAPSRLDGIETPLETLMRLAYHGGETSEGMSERCEALLKWLAHGKDERSEDWWGACSFAAKLGHRPRMVRALLKTTKRFPSFVREVLPQIETLQRLRLTSELDAVEEECAPLTGEWAELATRFPELRMAIEQLDEWQRVGGASELPSGIRELLGREEKWRCEAEFLRARLAQNINAHLQIRLQNLESRLEAGNTDIENELGEMVGSAIEAAIVGGLRSLVTRALRGRMRALCGSVVEQLEWSDDWANALLIACELESNRKWATKLLRGQSQNASGWQRRIPANEKWLEALGEQGRNRDVFEGDYWARIGGWELWIERDALQILQMGNRFSTCLSRGGCNSHSTIANALDANKLVVYARRDGQIQARQLWAISDEWRLGGFHIYANLSEAARQKSGVCLAFLEFARRFGGECGLELNEDTGAKIPEICGAQWYNDGLISWQALEKEAKREPSKKRRRGREN